MELHSEVLSASTISEVINHIMENAFDNSNNEETSESILRSDKENQSTPDKDEVVVEYDAINEFTSSSKEISDGESKNEISKDELQSDTENQSKPDEDKVLVENEAINEFSSTFKEMIADEGKIEISSSSEGELQSDEENQSKPDEDEIVVEIEAINEFSSTFKEMIADEGKIEISSSSEGELQSDEENQSKPDEDEIVVEIEAINEFSSTFKEMIADEGKIEISSSSEGELQSDEENQSKPDEDEIVVEIEAINEFSSTFKEMIADEGKIEISSSSEGELQSDEENQSKPDEDEIVVEIEAINEFSSTFKEMIADEGKIEISSSSEGELQSDEENQSKPDEVVVENDAINEFTSTFKAMIADEGKNEISLSTEEELEGRDEDEVLVENDEINEFTSSSKEISDGESKNEISSSAEEEIQLIDHVENVNGEAVSGDSGCEVLKVDYREMNDGKGHVFQKIDKSTDIALGDMDTAAVDNINNSLYLSGTESNTTTEDARILAKIGTNEGDDFYSNKLLRCKGFTLKLFDTMRILTNLALYSSTIGFDLRNSQVCCTKFPYQMKENHLIPLFEKAGKVYELKMILDKENRDKVICAYVTYTKKEDAEKATQILNHRKVETRFIRVVKHTPYHRLFVKGIPNRATKPQLFDKFNYLTRGLEDVFLFDSLEKAGKNRGFCLLDYVDHQKARDAKIFISKKKIFGQQLIAFWNQRRMKRVKNANKSTALHITNLHLNLHSSDLRKWFSVYGEVCEIDKTGNCADVVFRNWEDSQRAAREINKKLLGNDNVEISAGLIPTNRRKIKTQN